MPTSKHRSGPERPSRPTERRATRAACRRSTIPGAPTNCLKYTRSRRASHRRSLPLSLPLSRAAGCASVERPSLHGNFVARRRGASQRRPHDAIPPATDSRRLLPPRSLAPRRGHTLALPPHAGRAAAARRSEPSPTRTAFRRLPSASAPAAAQARRNSSSGTSMQKQAPPTRARPLHSESLRAQCSSIVV